MLKPSPPPGEKELIFELVQREKGEICHSTNWDKAEKMQMGRSCRRHPGARPAAFSTCRRSESLGRWDSGVTPENSSEKVTSKEHSTHFWPEHGVGHALLYSHRARENRQPALCRMSGTVGSDFKIIIKDPCKVFRDMEQAGDRQSFPLRVSHQEELERAPCCWSSRHVLQQGNGAQLGPCSLVLSWHGAKQAEPLCSSS